MMSKVRKKNIIFCIIICVLILILLCKIFMGSSTSKCYSIELGEYLNLPVIQGEVVVSEEDIQEELEHRLMKYAKYKSVEKREILKGDVVSIILVNLDDNSKVNSEIRIGDKEINAEFDDQILGMSKSDTKNVEINNIKYRVIIQEIKEIDFPRLSKKFVKEQLGCNSLSSYKKKLKEEIFDIKSEMQKDDVKSKLINLVVSDSKIKKDINEQVESQYKELRDSYEAYAKINGITYDDVLKQYETNEEKMRQHIEENIKQDIVVDAIFNKEHISLDKNQFNKLEMDYVSEYGYSSIEEFIEDCGEDYLKKEVKREYVKDFLYENAEIKENNN